MIKSLASLAAVGLLFAATTMTGPAQAQKAQEDGSLEVSSQRGMRGGGGGGGFRGGSVGGGFRGGNVAGFRGGSSVGGFRGGAAFRGGQVAGFRGANRTVRTAGIRPGWHGRHWRGRWHPGWRWGWRGPGWGWGWPVAAGLAFGAVAAYPYYDNCGWVWVAPGRRVWRCWPPYY
jgi:hypothetical protein